jgi:hypothetical protein
LPAVCSAPTVKPAGGGWIVGQRRGSDNFRLAGRWQNDGHERGFRFALRRRCRSRGDRSRRIDVGHLLHAASLTQRNLAAIWHNYAAFGIRRLLLAGAIESAARLEEVRSSIPDAHIVICRLRASIRAMEERVRWREPGMLQAELIERVSVLDAELDASALHDFVVENDERPITDVAREVLATAGWPGAAPTPGVPVRRAAQA